MVSEIPSELINRIHHIGCAAMMVDHDFWNTAVTQVAWSVQWKPTKGLMPVRPVVVFSAAGSLPAKKALFLKA